MLLKNAYHPSGDGFRHGDIFIEGGKIAFAGSKDTVVDCAGKTVLPGFIDAHIHGWGLHGVMDGEASLKALAEALPRFGVTSFLPSTYSVLAKTITDTLQAIRSRMTDAGGAQVLGAHLEGPCLNPEARGAQAEDQIRGADENEYASWFSDGTVKLLTLAPEVPGNDRLLDACNAHGVIASIGHSHATYAEAKSAIERGITWSTHTWNGMRGIHHREPGVVGAVLTDPRVTCELIADLHHVHPAILKLTLDAAGIERIVLVTDSVKNPSGADRITDAHGNLAGSALTMDQALRTMLRAAGRPLEAIWPITSRNAAMRLGLDKGEIAPGKDADLVLLDHEYRVVMTIIAGRVVYERQK